MELLAAFVAVIIGLAILGIIVSFSPTLIITEIAVLTRSKKPFIDSVALIAGIAVPVLILTMLAFFFANPDKTYDLPSTKEIVGSIPILDIIIGIVLLFAGARLYKPKSKKVEKTKEFKPEKLFSTKALFWFGLIKMSTSLSSLAAILIGVRYIKSLLTDDVVAQTVALIWLVAVSIFPFMLIASIQQYFPKTFMRVKASSDRIVGYNWRLVASVIMILAGIIFIITGVVNHDTRF